MKKNNYDNEVIKRKYYNYLENSQGYAKESIKHFKMSVWRWQEFTNNLDFIYFNQTRAENFKKWLKERNKRNSQVKMSLSHIHDTLRYLKIFFTWLSEQNGYRSKINKTMIDYLNLTRREVRIATQSRMRKSPTIEEAKILIESIQEKTEIEKRDKAMLSLTFLTGARISALSTLPIASFDREKLIIDQDPKLGVITKNSKRIRTTLIPFIYKEPLDYFLRWFDFLINEKNFKQTDPLFPATKMKSGNDERVGYYNTEKVSSNFWKSTSSPRKIFENRFKQAGLKYYHPHTFRHLIVREISKLPLSEEQRKAISQNLGHADVGTTFGDYGYGNIGDDRQTELIKNIDFSGRKTIEGGQISDQDIARIAMITISLQKNLSTPDAG